MIEREHGDIAVSRHIGAFEVLAHFVLAENSLVAAKHDPIACARCRYVISGHVCTRIAEGISRRATEPQRPSFTLGRPQLAEMIESARRAPALVRKLLRPEPPA